MDFHETQIAVFACVGLHADDDPYESSSIWVYFACHQHD